MSISPLSSNEIKNLRELIDKNGWKIEGTIENYFRYSLKKKKLILFTIKFPITLPIRINVPFEVVSFRFSIAFQFWNLEKDTYGVILYLMKALRNLAISLTLEHNFPIEDKKIQIANLLEIVIPELIKNEKENSWLNRIRISLLNKRDRFKAFSNNELTNILESLQKIALKPSFNIPWELNYGIPKLRLPETLLFSNNSSFDEFFILEKGYFTYFKDIEYNKIHLRGLFDSYSPYILKELFNDNPEFRLEALVENWIQFTRIILNSLIEIIQKGNINQNEFINFRPAKELLYGNRDFVEDFNNYPFSALSYESTITKELFNIHNDLFNKPPTNFEVLESLKQYTEAEELIKNYRFEEAANILNEALIVFNKNQQRKIVVSILLKLRKIVKFLGHEDTALNYLKNALGVAKSGDISIKYIIKLHYKLGVSNYETKLFQEALNHFNIIIAFLEKEEIAFNKKKYLGLAYLYIGLIYQEQKNIEESKVFFKNAFLIGDDDLYVKLRYFLLRGIYYKNRGNLMLTQKFLKAGFDTVGLNFENEKIIKILTDIMLELSEFYIHYKKDSRRAYYLLSNLENHIRLREISNMKRGIRWNLLMVDYYNEFELNREKSQFYLKQSQKLRNQLKTIGIDT
ncbi:MAG: tol-pal system YbgF family protein [Candidatus Thorarchaeota archaeon]